MQEFNKFIMNASFLSKLLLDVLQQYTEIN